MEDLYDLSSIWIIYVSKKLCQRLSNMVLGVSFAVMYWLAIQIYHDTMSSILFAASTMTSLKLVIKMS